MCGFSGILSKANCHNQTQEILLSMCESIAHRGPNDQGIWQDPMAGIGFAHTRLAVVDLSPAGQQPMVSASGRYVIAFNGEIYNHIKLREQLKIDAWRGHSDTETLLAGFENWGIETTIKRCIGMFAFALWDKKLETLTLGRDRVGEKPLYYGWQKNVFLFGSEIKTLKKYPHFRQELNHDALALFLRHNYIPAPYSIYENINKLPPGTLLHISLKNPQPVLETYWSAIDHAISGKNHSFQDEQEMLYELEDLLKNSISQQMIADVPLGAFLSGGIDSSMVVALMQAQSSHAVRTFSIGFHEKQYDEAKYAKQVANYLGTQHTELYVGTKDILGVIPKLSTLYDEPFSDSSQIPTFLVSELARQTVTVALSGDAGDELFCGYNRYKLTAQFWDKINKIPLPLRKSVAKVVKNFSPLAWDRLALLLPIFKENSNPGLKLHKGAEVLTASTVNDAYRKLVSHHNNPYSLLLREGTEPDTLMNRHFTSNLRELGEIEQMMVMDFVSYLPDDILVKVDRAAMGVSLETRIPFLDHRIIEFSWKIPLSMKLRAGQTKWPLRQLLYQYVPRDLIERPKMGFGIPLTEWLNGPLRNWAEILLDESRLKKEGIFNPKPIREMWEQHIKGKGNFSSILWNILMFQSWWEIQ